MWTIPTRGRAAEPTDRRVESVRPAWRGAMVSRDVRLRGAHTAGEWWSVPVESEFNPGAPMHPPAPPTARRRRLGRVVALVVTVVVVAAAATGVTVFLTRSKAAPQAAAGGGAAAASYASFEAEYPATKGAIARIDTIGCNGSAYVGTGFAIDAHHIVTASHVVEGSNTMTVTLDGNPVATQIVGFDASGDVALLQSDSALPGPYIPLADSAPGVGERVAAIGFPLGAGLTLTQGSVSALGQDLTVNNNQLAGLVQTDTALNPGNSGGPLVALTAPREALLMP